VMFMLSRISIVISVIGAHVGCAPNERRAREQRYQANRDLLHEYPSL